MNGFLHGFNSLMLTIGRAFLLTEVSCVCCLWLQVRRDSVLVPFFHLELPPSSAYESQVGCA